VKNFSINLKGQYLTKKYFQLWSGAIGVEVLHTKALLHYVQYLRDNGVEPIAVLTIPFSNGVLLGLFKKKFRELGVRFIDLTPYSHSYKVGAKIYWKRLKFYSSGMNMSHQLGSTKRFLDYLIHGTHDGEFKYSESPFMPFDFDAINDLRYQLEFDEDENAVAKKELAKMGVDRSFVCMHSRDDEFYLKQGIDRKDSLRNIPLDSYLPSVEHLKSQDIQVLRMGAKQESAPQNIFDENFIDYSSNFRSEFMDIWLCANCKFFLGNSSGIAMVGYLFKNLIPAAFANFSNFLYAVPYGCNDIYLPQKLWLKSENRFLTFKEIADNDIGLDLWTNQRYEKVGIECMQSSSEDILDMAKEMNDIIDGVYFYSEEDEWLQEQWRSIFKTYHAPKFTKARVSSAFLKKNRELFL
jgi:putative glycosyltransferase (TIGR04372 family)